MNGSQLQSPETQKGEPVQQIKVLANQRIITAGCLSLANLQKIPISTAKIYCSLTFFLWDSIWSLLGKSHSPSYSHSLAGNVHCCFRKFLQLWKAPSLPRWNRPTIDPNQVANLIQWYLGRKLPTPWWNRWELYTLAHAIEVSLWRLQSKF